jgi:hypothetical protein
LFINSALRETAAAKIKNNSTNTLSQTGITRQRTSRGYFRLGCRRMQPDTGDSRWIPSDGVALTDTTYADYWREIPLFTSDFQVINGAAEGLGLGSRLRVN